MCGIVGAVSANPINLTLVEQMRDRLIHRGPDHGGIWLENDAQVCLGHRRLAIVDLTPEANQPFISQDGRFVVTFNGEIYNFQDLRKQLSTYGVFFSTQSDTEVLVEAFRHWGEECLNRLSGMFAFAIWDKVERRLFCARDRVGEKPFYYTIVQGSFLFASEVKALLLWPGFRREIHYPALIDYLCFGFVVDPKSIWEGCYKLPPGHWLSVKVPPAQTPVVGTPIAYWDVEYQPDYSVKDWSWDILNTLQTASQEMAFANVPVGTFLSGGVDSSSVTAALSRSGCSVNTFTVGFHEQDYDERPWARQVSDLYGTTHTEKVVQPEDIASVFHKILWHYDEPFNDYSYLPTFYVCQEARRTISVALSGDGGDEMFAGYLKYQRLCMRQNVQKFAPQPFRSLLATVANSILPETNKTRRMLLQYGMDVSAMLADMFMTGFSGATLCTIARGSLAAALKHYAPMDAILLLLRQADPDRVGLINAMRYLDLKLTLAGDILVKVDRASMAVALEVRPVYLHRDVISLAAKIPSHLLADRNHSKQVLKTALRQWLPNDILFRRKQGFAMPLKKWLRKDLQEEMFEKVFTDPFLQELLDTSLLKQIIDSHQVGKGDLTAVVHSLFFLKNWLVKWM